MPTLATSPFRLPSGNCPASLACMLQMFRNPSLSPSVTCISFCIIAYSRACRMFGMCCWTFILNNTAPNGTKPSIRRAHWPEMSQHFSMHGISQHLRKWTGYWNPTRSINPDAAFSWKTLPLISLVKEIQIIPLTSVWFVLWLALLTLGF